MFGYDFKIQRVAVGYFYIKTYFSAFNFKHTCILYQINEYFRSYKLCRE